MVVEVLVLVILMALASAGSITRMVARSVVELQPTLLSAQSNRLRRYEAAGTIAYFIALSATSAWAVMAGEGLAVSRLGVALAGAILVLVVLVAAEIARAIAHGHLDTLAR